MNYDDFKIIGNHACIVNATKNVIINTAEKGEIYLQVDHSKRIYCIGNWFMFSDGKRYLRLFFVDRKYPENRIPFFRAVVQLQECLPGRVIPKVDVIAYTQNSTSFSVKWSSEDVKPYSDGEDSDWSTGAIHSDSA